MRLRAENLETSWGDVALSGMNVPELVSWLPQVAVSAGIARMPAMQMPTVEMLWEPHDPQEALEERFGFGDVASAARWVAATVEDRWDIRVDSCERIVISDRNALAWVTTPSGELILKWSVAPARFLRLSSIAQLTYWLDGQGLPVSAPMRSTDGRLQVQTKAVSMCLQRLVQGDLLDVNEPEQVRASGATLASLHHALADYPGTDQILPANAGPRPLAERITRWLCSAGEHVPEVARNAMRRLVSDAPADRLPTQLVHGDFRSSNILCTDGKIAAVIDFEEARLDHCIDELARSAVMLGTRYRNWGPVPAEVRSMFLAGYKCVRPLTPTEADWWDTLVLWYSLILVPPGEDPTGWGSAALRHLGDLASRRRPRTTLLFDRPAGPAGHSW